MTNITFVTGNAGKVESLTNRLPDDFSVHKQDLNIAEIQDNDVEVIAKQKALDAWSQVGKPVVVQDSGFHIDALNGFPGPYIKHTLNTIGPERIVRLLNSKEARTCYFRQALGYVDEEGSAHTFTNEPVEKGRIANEVAERNTSISWSPLWRIFIPADADKPLALFSKAEIQEREQSEDGASEFDKFAQWITSN